MRPRFLAARRDLLPSDRRPGTLAWMIAATSFLSVIAVAAALGLARLAERLDAAGLGRFTVELVDPDPARLDRAAGRLLAALQAEPTIATAARVPARDIATLLTPALGPAAIETLPLPALIDVTLTPAAPERALQSIVRTHPGAHLLRAADGLAPLDRLVDTLRSLALAIVAIAAVVTMLIAGLAARMALEAHAGTLATLHALGATDRDLAGLVQRRTARDALAGGLIGLLGGVLTSWIIGGRVAALGETSGGGALLGVGGWVVLACVPFLLAVAATLATRRAVLAALGRAP